MEPNAEVFTVILNRALSNVQGCINNRTDITRATSVGEKAWHIHKYTGPYATDKINLEEDIQLISNVASASRVKIFGSESDYRKLDNIITAWSQIQNAHDKIVPFKKIKQNLSAIKKQINN